MLAIHDRREVDRLAAAGDLTKQKLSARRSGFHRDGVEAYLAERAVRIGVPARVPASPAPSPSQSLPTGVTSAVSSSEVRRRAADAGERPGYGSPVTLLIVEVADGFAHDVGAALDYGLAMNGCPGCIITTHDGRLTIAWANTLPYTEAIIRKAIKRATAAVRVA